MRCISPAGHTLVEEPSDARKTELSEVTRLPTLWKGLGTNSTRTAMSDEEENSAAVGKRVSAKPMLNRRSTIGLLAATHKNATTYNRVWNLANKSPMFTRKPTITKLRDGTERKTVRTYRIGSSNQLSTFASAAAHVAAERAGNLGVSLRLNQEIEDRRAPVHLSQSRGFQLLIEQSLIAYVQVLGALCAPRTPFLSSTVHRKYTHCVALNSCRRPWSSAPPASRPPWPRRKGFARKPSISQLMRSMT
jgi:hypothetical protein